MTKEFVEEREAKLDRFLARHLSLQECLRLQRKHLLMDLLLNPLNALWTVPYLTLKKPLEILDQLGWDKAKYVLSIIPSNLKTSFQWEIEDLIARELLELDKDARLTPELLREAYAEISAHASKQASLSDLASSAATYVAAYYLFGDTSLNAFGLGRRIAALWARDEAASKFFLGKSLGKAYYSYAPPEPSRWQLFVAMALIFSALAVFSTIVNVGIAPLQNKLGFQRQSLSRLISRIGDRFILSVAKGA